MAYSYDSIITAQFGNIAAQQAQAAAELEAARHAQDPDRVNAAADAILDLQGRHERLVRIAQNYASQQAGAQAIPGSDDMSRADVNLCRQYGLSPGDLAIAKGWTGDQTMTDNEKIETYLQNRQKLAQMRASGQYRDDQGTVTRP